ncbi:MAG: hypothetical protein ACRENE_20905, partial [Polyangiaceae bacterium]
MANAPIPLPVPSDPHAVPVPGRARSDTLPECPGCGQSVDPLRAGHVAVLEGGFRYFCNAACKQRFLSAAGLPQEEEVATAAPPAVALVQAARSAAATVRGEPARPRVVTSSPRGATPAPAQVVLAPPVVPAEPFDEAPVARRAQRVSRVADSIPPSVPASWVRALPAIDTTGIVLGVLVPAIGLLGAVADVVRVPLVLASWGALALRILLSRRDDADPHLSVMLLPSLGAVCAAFWAHAVGDPKEVAIAVLAGLASAGAIAAEILVARSRARV